VAGRQGAAGAGRALPHRLDSQAAVEFTPYVGPAWLRVGDIRVFYDVAAAEVQVLAIITKSEAQAWLEREGVTDESGRTGEG
jgi:hypothetical protein